MKWVARQHGRRHAALPVVLLDQHDGVRTGRLARGGPYGARHAGGVRQRVAAAHTGRVLRRCEGEPEVLDGLVVIRLHPDLRRRLLVVVADRAGAQKRAHSEE